MSSTATASTEAEVGGPNFFTCTLTEGLRASPYPEATDRWKPPYGLHHVSDHSLYFGTERRLSSRVAALSRVQAAERGDWGIAVVLGPRVTVEDSRIRTGSLGLSSWSHCTGLLRISAILYSPFRAAGRIFLRK